MSCIAGARGRQNVKTDKQTHRERETGNRQREKEGGEREGRRARGKIREKEDV